MNPVNKNILALIAFLPLALACEKNGEDNIPGMQAVTYQASDANITNPERGFYTPSEISRVSTSGISKDSMESNRKMGRTLYLLEFHMGAYVNTDIADDYLETIRARFRSMREGGFKCILRFCYSNGFSEKDKPWDATPEQALRHIAQLKPLIQEYYDIIMVVQAGFIGSWGEWYYTENYDNASRKAIVDALLDAVPDCRQIALRTPAFKRQLYGFALADTITRATAHQTTPLARLGGHNDCYVSSANDQGTYSGPSDRKYWGAESLYTIMGGESCDVTPYCNCVGSDMYNGALKDLAINHVTYLNQSYHTGVINRWRSQGCYEEIQKRLGYRYVLDKGHFTQNPQAGEPFRVVLKLHNEGFAPCQNPRDAEWVLTDKSGKVLKTWPLDSDPRYWMPGEKITVDQTFTIPAGISGEVTLSLNLPDPCENLRGNPYYSIQLANEGTWDERTGFNTLHSFTL